MIGAARGSTDRMGPQGPFFLDHEARATPQAALSDSAGEVQTSREGRCRRGEDRGRRKLGGGILDPRRPPDSFVSPRHDYLAGSGFSPAFVMTPAASAEDRKRSSATAESGCCEFVGSAPT